MCHPLGASRSVVLSEGSGRQARVRLVLGVPEYGIPASAAGDVPDSPACCIMHIGWGMRSVLVSGRPCKCILLNTTLD